MDIVEFLHESHLALRRELEALEAPFRRPHGVGWDDRVSLDNDALQRGVDAFFTSFRRYEAAEDEILAEAAAPLGLDEETVAEFTKGRRTVADIMKLLGAVTFTCDGEHVHRVRELLGRTREEIENHLSYEEKVLFPLLKERLTPAQLKRLGEHVLSAGTHGASKR
ncbi:MAG: hemerythrin domain-containing protein [Elusimicrobiota bacterium]|nr:hemerythrin domain-containing protein [Elusimicrobiota bacterium]